MTRTLTELLTERDVARLAKLSTGSVARLRRRRFQPLPHILLGGAIRYRLADVEGYFASRTKPKTGEK